MTMHGCQVVAIEGTHAAGKTTLVHGLVAHYRARGVLVTNTSEPARASPFIEDIVLHGTGDFDLPTEVDLYGAQLTSQLRAARHHQLLICDRTIMAVLAYAQLVLPPEPRTAKVLIAMEQMCRAWAPIFYDAIILCTDTYQAPHDQMRSKVTGLQHDIAHAIRTICDTTGITTYNMPTGLSAGDRTSWAVNAITQLPDPA